MAKNDGLILLLLGLGALYLLDKRKAPISPTGQILTTETMTPYPVYYYRDIEVPIEGLAPEVESRYVKSWIKHVTRDPFIPSTTLGYHPEFQSIAIEWAHKNMPNTLRSDPISASYIQRALTGKTVETLDPEAPETQAMVQAYKQYAESRKTSVSGKQEKRTTTIARGTRRVRR